LTITNSHCAGIAHTADVVEFDDNSAPFPVEYKHGSRQKKEHDEIQLAAQALSSGGKN